MSDTNKKKLSENKIAVVIPFQAPAKVEGPITFSEALNVLRVVNEGTQMSQVEKLFAHAESHQATLAFMICQKGNLCALLSFSPGNSCKEFKKTLPQVLPNVAMR